MADGSRIIRKPGENFAQAAQRQHKANTPQQSTHFITICSEPASDDEEDDEVYAAE